MGPGRGHTVVTPVIGVVAMAADHVDDVMRIDAAVYAHPWSRALWDRELADSSHVHLVAADGGAIVGHAGVMYVLDEVHVTTVAVVPECQGTGIASKLLVALLDSAVAAGSTAATLEVRAAGRRAQRVYSRLGFVPVGVRRGYYRDPADDGIVMWLFDLRSHDTRERFDRVEADTRPEVAL